MGASSPAPSECLLPLITRSKKQFVPSENSLRSFPHSLSLCLSDTHTQTQREMKNAHKHPAHYAKAPAAGNTSPTGWQEGEERKSGWGRSWLVGWVGGWEVVKKWEWVRAAEGRAGIMSAVISFVYRPFWKGVEKLHWMLCVRSQHLSYPTFKSPTQFEKCCTPIFFPFYEYEKLKKDKKSNFWEVFFQNCVDSHVVLLPPSSRDWGCNTHLCWMHDVAGGRGWGHTGFVFACSP